MAPILRVDQHSPFGALDDLERDGRNSGFHLGPGALISFVPIWRGSDTPSLVTRSMALTTKGACISMRLAFLHAIR